MFGIIDTKHKESITYVQFKVALEKNTKLRTFLDIQNSNDTQVDDILKEIDISNDEQISLFELRTYFANKQFLHSLQHDAEPKSPILDENINRAFLRIDKDRNGRLTAAEIIKACRKFPHIRVLLGLPKIINESSHKKFEEIFQSMDEDGERKITFNEFLNFNREHRKTELESVIHSNIFTTPKSSKQTNYVVSSSSQNQKKTKKKPRTSEKVSK